MKKERAKGFVAGVLVMAMLSATLVFANSGIAREIHYGISVVLNGQTAQFDEDSRPFVMDDRTFLPLRAMAELLDLPVVFDAETNTAHVGYASAEEVLIGGTWEMDYGIGYRNERFEFFADGTGRFSLFGLHDTIQGVRYFTWKIDDNVMTIILPHDYHNDDHLEFYFAIYSNIFGSSDILLKDYDGFGWSEVLMRSR